MGDYAARFCISSGFVLGVPACSVVGSATGVLKAEAMTSSLPKKLLADQLKKDLKARSLPLYDR